MDGNHEKVFFRFLDEYDSNSERVLDAREQDYQNALTSWFDCIKSGPSYVKEEYQRLFSLFPYEELSASVIKEPGSMVGSGELSWPTETRARISAQLKIFELIASGENRAMDFAFDYFYSGNNNINDTISDMSHALFRPLAEDLRRHLTYRHEDARDQEDTLDAGQEVLSLALLDNKVEQVLERLDTLLIEIEKSNSILPDDKDRLKRELAAGREILSGSNARPIAINSTVGGAAKWIAEKFTTSAIGVVARELMDLLKGLF